MAEQVFHGVPRALALDGWWLNADADYVAPQAQGRGLGRNHLSDTTLKSSTTPSRKRFALVLALLALADILFFHQSLGLSIALFTFAIFVANLAEQKTPHRITAPALVLIAGNLPVIEYVQTASVLFAGLGLIVAVAWSRLGVALSVEKLSYGTHRLLMLIPVAAVKSGSSWLKDAPLQSDFNGLFHRFIRNWAIPLGGALLILSLLVSANPVLDRWMSGLLEVNFDLSNLVMRVLFWAGMALVLWPLLSTSADQLTQPDTVAPLRKTRSFGLNARSVTNALVLFNALLALQLVLDGQVFWGSGQLPAGVSYAEYAHRGAYPLLVTALLAGGFALAARPFLEGGRWLKPLMMVWLGLNVMLTLSSLYRLGIYIEAYGLTYLRIRAGIWMVLVALWLGMIAWQIGRAKGNGWLLLRSFALGAATLYLGCFVNFAHGIATYNLNHQRSDGYYLCTLNPTASGALWGKLGNLTCSAQKPVIDGWRDWGFRDWRVARYIKNLESQSATQGGHHENSGR